MLQSWSSFWSQMLVNRGTLKDLGLREQSCHKARTPPPTSSPRGQGREEAPRRCSAASRLGWWRARARFLPGDFNRDRPSAHSQAALQPGWSLLNPQSQRQAGRGEWGTTDRGAWLAHRDPGAGTHGLLQAAQR